MFRRLLLTAAAVALLAFAGAAAATPGLHVIYSEGSAADVIHDGTPTLPGLADAYRQAPVADDPVRWPVHRQLAKLSGRELSTMTAAQMEAAIRRALASKPGGLVGVDEITADQWGVAQSRALRAALTSLGPLAKRVVLYIGPALVSRVGKADPRQPLEPYLASLVAALKVAGAVQLETYGAGGRPFTQAELATYPTRWLARWAGTDPGNLHLLVGPAGPAMIPTIWHWLRGSPAGRQILANGPGAYGLNSPEEGLAWLASYREFLGNPTAPPPQGDYPVPVGGGVTVAPPKPGATTFTLKLDRPATAIVRLIPLDGQAATRVIGKVVGPTDDDGVTVRLPRHLPPGRYRIVTVVTGQGLRDVSNVPFTAGRRRTVFLTYRNRRLILRLAVGQRAVVRVIPQRGRARAIAKRSGRRKPWVIAIPRNLPRGAYRAVATAVGSGGRQSAAVRFRI